MMKFELMYYLGIPYRDVMQVDIAELNYYYNRLREVKEHEAEIEKMKLEAQMVALGARRTQKTLEGG